MAWCVQGTQETSGAGVRGTHGETGGRGGQRCDGHLVPEAGAGNGKEFGSLPE